MPHALRIASRQHPLVKRFRSLAARRDDDREILLDGAHLIQDAIDAGIPLDVVLTDGRHADLARAAGAAGVAVHEATPAVIAAATPVRSPSGVVAIARWGPAPMTRVFDVDPPFLLGLVDVQDPGNAGGVIRAADALDAGGVLALDGTADPAGWKALRGAMGSTFRVPVARGTIAEAIALARQHGFRIAATAAAQTATIETVDLTGRWLVLLGNEGAGLAAEVRRQADVQISVPMRARVESLNVAVTAALIAAEARRQRTHRHP